MLKESNTYIINIDIDQNNDTLIQVFKRVPKQGFELINSIEGLRARKIYNKYRKTCLTRR